MNRGDVNVNRATNVCCVSYTLDAWIIFAGLLALVVVYPYGNVSAMDAWFFGVSASTESGLNTFVKQP
jgi:hypothetical protein